MVSTASAEYKKFSHRNWGASMVVVAIVSSPSAALSNGFASPRRIGPTDGNMKPKPVNYQEIERLEKGGPIGYCRLHVTE